MSFIAFRDTLGTLPLEHLDYEDDGKTIEDANVLYGVGMVANTTKEGVEAALRPHDGEKRSPIHGWFHVGTADEEARKVGTWRTGAALAKVSAGGVAGGTVKARLIKDGAFIGHEDLEEVEVFMDPGGAARIAAGMTVLVTRAQIESEHVLLGSVTGDAPLIAQWRGPDISEHSSVVHDITDAGELDELIAGHLGQVFRVTGQAAFIDPDGSGSVVPGPGGYSLAWNLADSPETHFSGSDPYALASMGRGLMVGYRETGELSASKELVAGLLASTAGGVISFGYGASDPHLLGTTTDGLPLVPAHLSTEAPWFEPFGDGDGEMRFEGPGYWGGEHGSLRTRVHLQFDSTLADYGQWIWWVYQQNFPPMEGSPEHPAGTNLEQLMMGGITFQPTASWEMDLSRAVAEPPPERPRLRAGAGPIEARAHARSVEAWRVEREAVEARNLALQAEIFRRAHDTPCTVRTIAFGAEGGASEWVGTREGYADRLPGGLVAGGAVDLPASWTLDDVDAAADLPAEATDHPAMWRVACRVGRAIANRIDRTNGLPVDGWRETVDSSGDVTDGPYDADNAAQPSRRRIYQGVIRTESARQRKARGTSGTDTITATDDIIIWDTSGGAAVANMAAATGSGQVICVNNIGGNNLTMTPAAGNIDGAATVVLAPGGRRQWVDFSTNHWRAISA